jgi:asparagine N-glycosylation enzyme membrane subunit Stt3
MIPSMTSIYGTSIQPIQFNANWQGAIYWLRDNVVTSDKYLSYDKQKSIGVLTWWDYGAWIMRESHLAPSASPQEQTPKYFAKWATSRDLFTAEKALDGLDFRYIVIDASVLTGKWYAVQRVGESNITPQDSMAGQTWMNKYPEKYRLVYANDEVHVYERLN